jgi:two-component system response regulator YesN
MQSNYETIDKVKEKLHKEWIKHTSNQFICSSDILINGILNLYSTYQNLLEIHKEEKQLTKNIVWVIDYIKNHYSDPDLNLQQIADQCYVSPSYLTRIMRQNLGLSFIEYVTEIRLNKAMELLKTNDDEIYMYEIAKSVGYNSQHYFSRIFKSKTGVSPKEYKKKFYE